MKEIQHHPYIEFELHGPEIWQPIPKYIFQLHIYDHYSFYVYYFEQNPVVTWSNFSQIHT